MTKVIKMDNKNIFKWILEDYGDEFIERMASYLDREGYPYKFAKIPIAPDFDFFDLYSDKEILNFNDHIIFFGTLYNARRLYHQFVCNPGAYCHFENLCCTKYYSYWGKYLLNEDYYIIPIMELVRKKNDFYHNIRGYCGGSIFIRPNSGAKTFTGQSVKYEDFENFIEDVEKYGKKSMDDILCIISSHKKIEEEWRVVVFNNEVLTYSQYMNNGEIEIKREIDDGALELAEEIATLEWQPDIGYTLDICKYSNRYYLLEANSLSCAGLYSCDEKIIIDKILDYNIKEYRSRFGYI
jgi:hypothetical protein